MWSIATTVVFDEWFSTLDDDAKSEFIAVVELLKLFGPQLSRPHADTLTGSAYANMKELRAKTSTEVLRVAFAFDPARNAILLVGGNKSGVSQKRFYRQLIDRADQLYGEHLASLRKKGKGH